MLDVRERVRGRELDSHCLHLIQEEQKLSLVITSDGFMRVAK